MAGKELIFTYVLSLSFLLDFYT